MEQTLSDKPVTACKMIATGIALPPTRVTSAELDARPGKPAGYVEKRCGIAWRYHASLHDSQAELALEVAAGLLEVGDRRWLWDTGYASWFARYTQTGIFRIYRHLTPVHFDEQQALVQFDRKRRRIICQWSRA